MNKIDELKKEVVKFRDRRDWLRYHNPKDLSISISVEAAELLELFQWRDPDMVEKERVEEEMADVFIYLLSLVDVMDIDLGKAVMKKLEKNRSKYPVEDSKRF